MKIQKFIAISLFVLTFGASSAFALDGVAVIDIEKISKEAVVVKNVAKIISKKRDEFQLEVTKKEKKLEKEGKEIESQKNYLSKEKLEDKQKDFIKKVDELKDFATKRDKSLKAAYSDAIKEVNEKVGEIVAKIAEEKGLALVIPTSQVVYSVDGLDITNEVINQLNKKIKKVKVKFN
jgi:Skp family chaperone for outer membrane proteins